jgi:3-hydroxy-D-aspartate aldolase
MGALSAAGTAATTPPARVGDPVDAIDTPALLVDLDAFERNLERMADRARALGVRLRPHAKTHKSPEVAKRQIARGAVGVCVQKVAEAEAMVDGGIDDVFVSNEIVGASKLARLATLARRARLAVCVDDAGNAADLSRAATAAGASIGVFVEIDVGGGRCGVAPGAPALALARAVHALPGLGFAGLHAYHGSAQHLRSEAERQAAIGRACELAADTRSRIESAGLAVPLITGAGTGTFEIEAASGVYGEIQAGSYVFMDVDYSRNQPGEGSVFGRFEHSLFILSTVMSRPAPARAVCDAGHKASSSDSGFPGVADLPGARYTGASDEHGVILLDPPAAVPALGERIRLVPGHCDPTVNLHDWLVGVRGGRVECLWPVSGRGPGF